MEHVIKCPHCGYDWEPRVPKPKTCPNCKRPLEKTEQQLKKEHERELILLDIKPVMPGDAGFFQCKYCSNPAISQAIIDGAKEYLCKEHAIAKLAERKQPDQTEAARLRLIT